jgi:hypothetical protein
MKAIVLSLIFSSAVTFLSARADDQQPGAPASSAQATNTNGPIHTNLEADVQALNQATAKLNEAQAKLAAEKAKLDAVNEAVSDDVMRQVQQAVDAAMAAAKANVGNAGQTASAALANAGQLASAALANANAAAADAGGKWTLDAQLPPQAKSSFSQTLSRVERPGSGGAPAVIATRALNPQTRLDLQADLRIMDKLLQEKMSRVEATDSQPAFTFNWNNRQMDQPLYIDDFGVVFNGRTSVVLAGTESKPKHAPAEGESDWDRAKKEVESDSGLPRFSQAPAGTVIRTGSFKTGVFREERLDQLVKTIIQALPEAKHIRGLKDSDAVIITVAGGDDAGNAARLTVKTKKSDLDDLSSGKLKPEDFASRVVWSVN